MSGIQPGKTHAHRHDGGGFLNLLASYCVSPRRFFLATLDSRRLFLPECPLFCLPPPSSLISSLSLASPLLLHPPVPLSLLRFVCLLLGAFPLLDLLDIFRTALFYALSIFSFSASVFLHVLVPPSLCLSAPGGLGMCGMHVL